MSPQVAGALGRAGGGEVGQAWATCSLELVPEVARGRVGEVGPSLCKVSDRRTRNRWYIPKAAPAGGVHRLYVRQSPPEVGQLYVALIPITYSDSAWDITLLTIYYLECKRSALTKFCAST